MASNIQNGNPPSPAASLPEDDDIGIDLLFDVQEAPPPNILISGSMKPLPIIPPMSMEAIDLEKGFYIESGGTPLNIKYKTEDQKKRCDEIYKELTKGFSNASINITQGWVEENSFPVKFLDQDSGSREAILLNELRQLYHAALGQRHSSTNWPTFEKGDRAALNDPPPFQKRRESEALKRIQFSPNETPKERLKEYHFSKKIHEGIVDFLNKQIQSVDTRVALNAETRKSHLVRKKEQFEKGLDEVVLGFHAAFPPPDLSGLTTLQEKMDALAKYKKEASEYLNQAVEKNQAAKNIVKRNLWTHEKSEPNFAESIDQMASEMALLACKTRNDYEHGCLFFKTPRHSSSPEPFIARLSALAANGANASAIHEFLEHHFSHAFRGLSYEDDKEAVRTHIQTVLIPQIQSELDDAKLQAVISPKAKDPSAEYNRGLDQLKKGKTQQSLAEEQRKIATELRTKRADLAKTADALDGLGKQLEGIATRLNTKPADKHLYKKMTQQILGVERPLGTHRLVGLKNDHTIVKALSDQLAQLQNESNQTDLKPLINRLHSLIEQQRQFGHSLTKKV